MDCDIYVTLLVMSGVKGICSIFRNVMTFGTVIELTGLDNAVMHVLRVEIG